MTAADGPVVDRLSRRRTIVGLAGVLVAAAGYGYGRSDDRGRVVANADGARPVTAGHLASATAVAEAVYPTRLDVDPAFLERELLDRVEPVPGHFDGFTAAVEALDARARARHGAPIATLPVSDRRAVLRGMGVTAVHPDPAGTTAARVRHYLVNDLLYALFTSPLSTPLTGIQNPPGHPGGRDAYRRRPDDA